MTDDTSAALGFLESVRYSLRAALDTADAETTLPMNWHAAHVGYCERRLSDLGRLITAVRDKPTQDLLDAVETFRFNWTQAEQQARVLGTGYGNAVPDTPIP